MLVATRYNVFFWHDGMMLFVTHLTGQSDVPPMIHFGSQSQITKLDSCVCVQLKNGINIGVIPHSINDMVQHVIIHVGSQKLCPCKGWK